MEIYGAYLSYSILQPFLQTNPANPMFSKAHWNDLVRVAIIAVNVGGLSIAGVGMLTVATAALPLGLLAYHCYLIWAGMTTNESQKWADLRDDMADGYVFKASHQALRAHNQPWKNNSANPIYAQANGDGTVYDNEPSDQVLVMTSDGRPPIGQEELWTQVWSLGDIVNLHDLGGWDNFVEILKGR
ncbi:palmitoyltransferase swf1 [Vermiconidia calcicola]|uniref:Palmitoyltransferase swf1 n=1 Tax=Vermiconidia calcicola TaxID=1690605 RepID=A0ACC3MYT7_9PEZI|nr:palmitoyltransferase swf1 [Vermiconidia calcicola]